MKSKLLILAAFLWLVACASTPMLTDKDVVVADNRGQLEGLYTQIQTELQQAKYGSDVAQNRQLYLTIVGRKIAENKEREILNALDRNLDNKDIATLNASLEQAKTIEPYNREVYLELEIQLKQAIEAKQKQVDEKESQFKQLSDDNAVEKVQLLDDISKLWGGQQAKDTLQRKADYISQLFNDASLALQQKRNEDVKRYLDNLKQIAAGDERLKPLQEGLILVKYERQFWDALSKGDTEKAYQMYYQLNQIPNYLTDHPDVKPIAQDMLKYFLAEADKKQRKKDYRAAYPFYAKARYMKNSLAMQQDFSADELKFIALVEKNAKHYLAKQQWLPAYAYLSVLSELNPDNELVGQSAANVNQKILDQASIKIKVNAFMHAVPGSDLGGRFAMLINQALSALGMGVYNNDTVMGQYDKASYYEVKGELLKAVVGETKRQESEAKTVQVSTQRIENPDYVAWTKLDRKERKQTPEPASIIEVPVEKTIHIDTTHIAKQAAVSVTYRVSSVLDQQILYADAINQDKTYQATASAAINEGLFVQPEKKAELPDNKKALEDLLQVVANEASEKISQQFKLWPEQLLTKAEQSINVEAFNQAEAYYIYAYVLQQRANSDSDAALEQLRNNAFRWKD